MGKLMDELMDELMGKLITEQTKGIGPMAVRASAAFAIG